MRAAAYIPIVASLAAALAPEVGATNGARPIAFGPQAQGRGGVDTGIADDATAINTNPGGIGFIDGQRFDSSLSWVHPNINFSGGNADPTSDLDPSGTSVSNAASGSMAFVFDFDEPTHLGEALTFEDSGEFTYDARTSPSYTGSGLKFGLGIFPVAGNRVKLHATTPFWDADATAGLARAPQKWESDVKEITLEPAFAVRLSHWLSVGLAAGFIYEEINQNQPSAQPVSILQGHPLGNSGPTYAQTAPFLGVSEIQGFSSIHHARTYGGRARLGALFQPLEWLSFGISYASPTVKQDYLGNAVLDFSRQIQKIDPNSTLLRPVIAANTGVPIANQTFIGNYKLRAFAKNEPQEISSGVAFRIPFSEDPARGGLTIGSDVTWINWSATYRRLDARLSDGSSAELNELTGDTSGTVVNRIPLDWKDQVVFAAGIAIAPGVDWMVIRAGYNYGTDPVPSKTLQPTLPAILQHHVTLGLSYFIRRVEVTFNFEQDFRAKQTIKNSIVNSDLNGTTVDAQVQFISLGMSVRF
jgi:long-subunit fatty acid transport protein